MADELCCKHPFLKFTKEKPRPGNPYWEFGARVYVWNAAFDALGYSQFKQELGYFPWDQRGLQECIKEVSQGDYELLWNPEWFLLAERFFTHSVYEEVFWDRPEISNQKRLLLRRYAYGELWAFTQRLKLQELNSAQEQDRQRLEFWTILQIKETLIAYELEPTCPSEIDDSDVEPENVYYKHKEDPTKLDFLLKAKAVATRIVERRTAKGNWQVRGRHVHQYKFKFNGIETDT
ncbi:hypothetical protein MMC22_007101 [Lobaria immixta]|nr:hypothetical protein [Lobaria immixta]